MKKVSLLNKEERKTLEGCSTTRVILLCCFVTLNQLIFFGCGTFKGNAVEGDKSVGVLIEGSNIKALQPELLKILEKTVRTPQSEKTFELTFGDDDQLSTFSQWQNVLLTGTLDGEDRVSLRLKKMLKGEVLEGVREGNYFIFRKQDLWVRGQTVIFLVGPSQDKVKEWLIHNGK